MPRGVAPIPSDASEEDKRRIALIQLALLTVLNILYVLKLYMKQSIATKQKRELPTYVERKDCPTRGSYYHVYRLDVERQIGSQSSLRFFLSDTHLSAIEELVGTTSLGLISVQLLMSSTVMVEDIKSSAASRQWSFAWCNREKNGATHWIATNCLSRKLLSFTGCIPPQLDLILAKEVPS
ncbi:hypothetical protein RHMOL_Rhmol05G0020400 [Rhododendron molle]|uniref:Uncharacterized protein n=1 Tax=Rhododendron molle TaxID=49168 RepID=A0ACC0NLM2_RHOML|nr:hypothetical protein RHMOL_Rhmol05G0020400 [Rhododendron molle]